MNVLIVGQGGREHALAWKIRQSPRVKRVFVAPGNAGTAFDAENVDISADDFPRLIKFAQQNDVRLTVVGPEVPLVNGIVDAFQAEGLRIFGPSKAAAELEGSKVFCKNLLRAADVATAEYRVFRDAASATHFLKEREDVPIVVKADGLCAGKGAIVCDNRAEAITAVERIARDKEFGSAGDQLVIEERMEGREVSVLVISDGQNILTLPTAQDHKRAYDFDKGPNTGGMGAYSPTDILDEATMKSVIERIIVPTVHTMKRGRRKFRGVLYAGLMLTNQGPKVLEYNVRFGDPECQPLLMRLKSDLVDVLEATIDERLDELPPLEWDPRPAVCVVMASEGYPGKYTTGKPIRGLDEAAKIPDVKVFHAGTVLSSAAGAPAVGTRVTLTEKPVVTSLGGVGGGLAAGAAGMDERRVLTAGGRVLGVTAIGQSISQAKLQAYTAVKCIRWEGAWCRKDISDQALQESRGNQEQAE